MHPLRRSAYLATPLMIALSSCAVGPDFERPAAPSVQSYDSAPLPDQTIVATKEPSGVAQSFQSGKDIPGEWWALYHSEPLNALIKNSLQNNPDIDAAKAALRQAHEQALAGEGALFPSVDVGLNVEREKLSAIEFGGSGTVPPFTLYNASVNVSYSPDVFGGTRRSIEALDAQEEYQHFQLEAARISLTGNVVTTAITEASLRAQIDATQAIIDNEQKSLNLLQNQFQLGAIAKSSVLQQNATLAQEKATLPALENQLAQTRHELSILAGQFPSQAPPIEFTLKSLTLPDQLPVSLPSQLVAQRPDVRAAEATLHAASAEIGVATANMLPQFPLTADIGSDAGKLIGLLEPAGGIWSIAAGLTQPIFHGGELLHQKRASEAAFEEAAAEYRKTVLAAFKDVADSLQALQSDAEALKAQHEAEQASADSLVLSQAQYKDGAVSYLTLLTAEQTEQQTLISLVQAEAKRFADTAALFTALGGGWWNNDESKGSAQISDAAAPAAPVAVAAVTPQAAEAVDIGAPSGQSMAVPTAEPAAAATLASAASVPAASGPLSTHFVSADNGAAPIGYAPVVPVPMTEAPPVSAPPSAPVVESATRQPWDISQPPEASRAKVNFNQSDSALSTQSGDQ